LSWFADLVQQEVAVLLSDWLNRKLGWTKRKAPVALAAKPKRKKRPSRAKKAGK
jgi:hypothetical protein